MSEKPTGQMAEPEPLFQAILGDGPANPGRANLRLIRHALYARWPLPEEKIVAIRNHLEGVIKHEGGPGHARNVLAAVQCLLAPELAELREEEARARRKARRPAGRKRQGAGFMAGYRGLGPTLGG
jgi:hypothetical protein